MIATLTMIFLVQAAPAEVEQPANSNAASVPAQSAQGAPEITVKKEIVYKKETNVDLTGSIVEGENQLPPAFFLEKMQTPKAQGLLAERLRFSLRNYNDMGF
jgi:hypothetical protein